MQDDSDRHEIEQVQFRRQMPFELPVENGGGLSRPTSSFKPSEALRNGGSEVSGCRCCAFSGFLRGRVELEPVSSSALQLCILKLATPDPFPDPVNHPDRAFIYTRIAHTRTTRRLSCHANSSLQQQTHHEALSRLAQVS